MTGQRLSSGPAKPETRRPRDPNNPRPGYYAYHFGVRGPNGRYQKGPRVGARVWRACTCTIHGGPDGAEHAWQDDCDRHPPLICDVDGIRYDPPLNRADVPMIEKVELYSEDEPITEAEYRYLLDAAAWDRAHQPGAPAANPTKPIDLLNAKPIF